MTAVCEVWAVELGWDVRLMIDGHGLQMSSRSRSGREMVDRANEWRAAIVEKGWEGEPSDSEEPDEPPLTEEPLSTCTRSAANRPDGHGRRIVRVITVCLSG